jgi:hypothetical protein
MNLGPYMKAMAIIILSASLLLTGCIAPIPHRTVQAYGVKGRIVSAEDDAPVARAQVIDSDEARRAAETDAEGRFLLSKVHQWHGAYLIGIALNHSIWPNRGCVIASERTIRITSPGYLSRDVRVTRWDESRLQADDVVRARVYGKVLHAGVIRLRRASSSAD